MSKNKPDWYVVYLDVLGVSSMLKDDEKLIGLLQKSYDSALDILNGMNYNWSDNTIMKIFKTKFRGFSDNMVMAVKCDDVMDEFSLPILLFLLSLFQAILLYEDGITIRGGICRGQITFRKDFVIGPALKQAYNLEQDAGVPRIILDDDLVPEAIKYFGKGSVAEKLWDNDCPIFIKDKELSGDSREGHVGGYYYIDYIRRCVRLGGIPDEYKNNTFEFVENAKKVTSPDMSNERVVEKYKWLEEKFEEILTL